MNPRKPSSFLFKIQHLSVEAHPTESDQKHSLHIILQEKEFVGFDYSSFTLVAHLTTSFK
jgi:hypothetical protein